MKTHAKIFSAAIALLLSFFLLFVSCDKVLPNDGDENKTEEMLTLDYSNVNINEAVRLGEYKNITVDARTSNLSPDVLLFNAIVENAEIISYPEDAVSYYEDQKTRLYINYAQKGGMSYDELLASLSITQEDIVNEAKEYVKSDLVKLSIIEAEGLHLTDDEKTKLFDKYAYKFTLTYGHTVDYVYENLKDDIYDAMQYDKMMEFLLINNTVITLSEE